MASLMRSAASLLRRPAVSSAQWVLRRRSSYYKPREQSLYADAVEKLSTRDVTLFRYENPGFITRRNLVAVLFVPIFGQMAHLAFTLKSRLDPYREQAEDAAGAAGRAWVQDNVFRASRGVGIAFFLAGVSLCAYWVLRNLHTVRQLVLRRGGKHLTIVSYGFTGGMSRVSTVPVVHVSIGTT